MPGDKVPELGLLILMGVVQAYSDGDQMTISGAPVSLMMEEQSDLSRNPGGINCRGRTPPVVSGTFWWGPRSKAAEGEARLLLPVHFCSLLASTSAPLLLLLLFHQN